MTKHNYQTLKKHNYLYLFLFFILSYICFFNLSLRGMSDEDRLMPRKPAKTAEYYYNKARALQANNLQEQEGQEDQNGETSGPSSSLETVSKYSKLSCDVSWVLKDCIDIASTCLYFLGYEKQSKLLDKGALFIKFFWGASKVTHGTSETIRTGEKKHLLSIGSGLVCIGSSYLQYSTREEYHNLLSRKEALGKEKKAIKSQIKEIEDKKEKLGTDSQMEESWDELNRSLIIKNGTLSAIDEESKNRSFQILGIECADEVCTRTAEDISEGKDIKSSIAKNLAMVVLRKLPHSTVKENSERIRSRIKELLESTKARIMETMFKDIGNSLDTDPALYFIPS